MKIKVAVVEDDDRYAKHLRGFIDRYASETGVEIEAVRYSDAERFLSEYRPGYSVVYMDIELGGMNGISAAAKLRETDEVVSLIFVTNMMQYARQGYDVNAAAFMVKPVIYSDFKQKTDKAIAQWRANSEMELVVPLANGFHRLSPKNIVYVEVMGHRLRYHTVGGIIETGGSLTAAEKQLAPCGFLRCNSCFLVNPRHIVSVKGHTLRTENDELMISHPKRREFMRKLMEWYEGGG